MSEAKSILTVEVQWENDTLKVEERVYSALVADLQATVLRHFDCDMSELRAYLMWRRGQMSEPEHCARWEWVKDPYAEHHQKEGYLRCSKCRRQAPLDWYGNEVTTPYCPNCGAKMDYREGDEDD